MELKYIGPKPIISHTGIEFDNNKEDKYAYLNIVLQLLKALDHKYFENKTYVYESDTKRYTEHELSRELAKYCPDIEAMTNKENHDVEDEIRHNIQRANNSETLDEESKKVLTNNINIMHDYLVQRSINKSVYYCAINALAQILKKDHIDHIIVPMFQKYAHILHSIQGALKAQKFPIDTKLEIYQKDAKLLAKLQVINIV